jgi:hypothetical protein
MNFSVYEDSSFWRYVYDNSSKEKIGSKRRVLLLREYNLDFVDEFSKPTIYLGNSQNYFFIRDYSQIVEPNIMYVSLPVFSHLDYLGHYRKVLRYDPSKVIIHLSSENYDNNYDLSLSRYYDRLNFEEFLLASEFILQEIDLLKRFKLLSEFLFRQLGFNIKYLYANNFFLHNYLSNGILPDKKNSKNTKSNVSPESNTFNLNLSFEVMSKSFIELSKYAPVIIVEAQYGKEIDIKLNKLVQNYWQSFSQAYENIHYISKNEVYQFKKEDYTDGAHPKFDKGYLYNISLMKRVDELLDY